MKKKINDRLSEAFDVAILESKQELKQEVAVIEDEIAQKRCKY